MDVPSLMRQAMTLHRHRTALVTDSRSLTFGEAWDRGVRTANGLRALGVRPGDRVASVEDNDLGAADLFLGAAIAGAVRVPLYARNARRAHQQMVEQTQTRVLVVDATHADEVKGLEDPTEARPAWSTCSCGTRATRSGWRAVRRRSG